MRSTTALEDQDLFAVREEASFLFFGHGQGFVHIDGGEADRGW